MPASREDRLGWQHGRTCLPSRDRRQCRLDGTALALTLIAGSLWSASPAAAEINQQINNQNVTQSNTTAVSNTNSTSLADLTQTVDISQANLLESDIIIVNTVSETAILASITNNNISQSNSAAISNANGGAVAILGDLNQLVNLRTKQHGSQ